MGLLFFPRGGSSHVAQNLARALPAAGWDVTICSGSVTLPGRPGDAAAFYRGLEVEALDMTAALDAPDPVTAEAPFHPSYEERADAPDRVMCSLDDTAYEHQVAGWAPVLERARAASADVLHLHHLTPINEAAARVASGVPVVGHLHGTELLMLEAAQADPGRWPHSAAWVGRMRRWAAACERLILLSETAAARAEGLLGIEPGRCVVVPNGFDPQLFAPRELDRAAHWRRHLVDAPQGWAPGQEAGSIAYTAADLAPFGDPEAPVLLYVGRFTEVKRIGLLIESYARAREAVEVRAPLVILGGFPGEWEGEHPLETVRRLGVEDVFLAGWHGHDALAAFLNASDVVVLPSVREQFGQVLVEGMACGLPCIAVDAYGPSLIVRDGETGRLVAPDDVAALTAALVEALADPGERRRRGENALRDARERFAWPALAREVAAVYASLR